MSLWPSRIDTVSSGTPGLSRSTENVSRSRWLCPSGTPAMTYTSFKRCCHSVIALFGVPIARQKKYWSPSSHAMTAFTTCFGSGTHTGCLVFSYRRKSLPSFNVSRRNITASEMRIPIGLPGFRLGKLACFHLKSSGRAEPLPYIRSSGIKERS